MTSDVGVPGPSRWIAALGLSVIVAVSCEPASTPTATPAPPPPAPTTAPSVASSSGCATPQIAGAILGRYRTLDGRCLGTGRLLAVRCSPDAPPLLVRKLHDRRPLVYMGGRFAVPITAMDADAVPIGLSATERVFTLDRQLFVEAGGQLTRWLALPQRQRVVERGPNASMIGDSILEGAVPMLPSVFPAWELMVDALTGRTSSGGRPLVAAAVATRPEVVVIELGTNVEDPSVVRANADAMLAQLARVPLVVWVVPQTPSDLGPAMGQEIREAVAEHPNATTADWDAFVPDEALMPDGVHLLADRVGLFAEFLRPFLNGWLAVVRGRGALSCLDPVRGTV